MVEVVAGPDLVAGDRVVESSRGSLPVRVVWVEGEEDLRVLAHVAAPSLFGSSFVDVRLTDVSLLPQVVAAFGQDGVGVVRVARKLTKQLHVPVHSAEFPTSPSARQADVAAYAATLGVELPGELGAVFASASPEAARNAVRAAASSGLPVSPKLLSLCVQGVQDVTWKAAAAAYRGELKGVVVDVDQVDPVGFTSWLANHFFAAAAASHVELAQVGLSAAHTSTPARSVSGQQMRALVDACVLARSHGQLGVLAAAAAAAE